MRKILVVEDNKDMAHILKVRLEKSGFAVDVVESGFGVLKYVKDNPEPAAVVLDLFIPERSGMELLNTLLCSWEYAKIFIFSAHSRWEEDNNIRHANLCGFFCKTDGIDKLIASIEEALPKLKKP